MKICNKHDIDVSEQGKKLMWHATTFSVSNLHHYKYNCLFSI